MQTRGIIFDLDGVLLHSNDSHREAFEKVLAGYGIEDFEYPPYAGWRTEEVFEDIFKRRSIESGKIAEASREKTRLAAELIGLRKPVAPGAEIVLATLAASLPLALASSGSRSSVDSFLRLTGSASLFTSTLSGSDVTRAKPDPEIYRRSAQALGLAPSDCVVVEDAIAGAESARAAGCAVFGIGPDAHRLGATRIISSLCELPALLTNPAPIDKAQWTAVIPAAGRGSRLGFHRAKILYPVAGRPILDWLLDFLRPNCGSLVFVLSPDTVADVRAELEKRIPGNLEFLVQETPTGMGDAVALALERVRTANLAIVWGDQVALRNTSVAACLRLHQGPLTPDATVPTVTRLKPYIHFERDAAGKIVKLLQAREGDAMPEEGESDTGFFCFRADALRLWLDELRKSGEAGSATREMNLLPVIPIGARHGRILTPRCVTSEETVGVNSPEDAIALEAFLRRSHA